jgi:D-alanyl-D-alanine carboxypeptidase (penicillin-binding protein 5/6)
VADSENRDIGDYLFMRKIGLLSLVFCLCFVSTEARASSLSESRPKAKAWLILDQSSGEVLRFNNQSTRLPIASTTKLLTALLVKRKGDLGRWVTISSKAATQQPSKVGLLRGEKWRRRDLLKALLIKSANDSAVALAESVSGSEAAFCKQLDSLAKKLGCKNTHILRASGLPAAGQYSTVNDLAKITKAVFADSSLKQILSWKTTSIRSSKGRRLTLTSRNRYVKKSSAPVHGKTGYTRRAQRCFSGTILVGGRKYTVVFLGSSDLWGDLAKLRQWTINFDAAKKFNESHLNKSNKKKWQLFLSKKGFDAGVADGVWGVKTQKAFLKFQDSKKLSRDGLIGPQAWRNMK